MTLGQIDYHLFAPWLPVERFLYPMIGQFLADWARTQAPLFEELRIVGPRWGPRSHELRDRLARVGVPYGFYANDSEPGRRLLEEVGQAGSDLPVVVFHTGQVLVDPSTAEVAEALGAATRLGAGRCDLTIVGAGPAGLAAAVSAASEGLRTLVVEPVVPGGQAGITSSLIRNYPGFPHGISGDEPAYRTFEQAWLFGADFVFAQQATGLGIRGSDRVLSLSGGGEVAARVVVIATGVTWRRLGVPAVEALHLAGVFYGAGGAEAEAVRGQDVFVVGAGNSAGQAAVHLARMAASVTVLVRGRGLAASMSEYLVKEIDRSPNITVRFRTEVVDTDGQGRLEALTLRDQQVGARQTIPAHSLFIMIGGEPHTDWLAGRVERDDQGYLLAGPDLLDSHRQPPPWPLARLPLLFETSVPGVFAVGDVRHRSVKRVASAVGEGAVAVRLAHQYLEALHRAHPRPGGGVGGAMSEEAGGRSFPPDKPRPSGRAR
jgi:thioredoxin reductase (NADPH)